MSTLVAVADVDVPYEDVPDLAYRYLESFPSNLRDGSHFIIRAWIANVVFEREVMLKMVPTSTDPHEAIMDVRWRPLSGPYPSFSGKLHAVRGDRSSCRIELDGAYVPPGGIAGKAFDAVLGHRIAEESVTDLLARFKAAFEQLHAESAT